MSQRALQRLHPAPRTHQYGQPKLWTQNAAQQIALICLYHFCLQPALFQEGREYQVTSLTETDPLFCPLKQFFFFFGGRVGTGWTASVTVKKKKDPDALIIRKVEDQLKSLAPVTFIPGVFLWRVCGNHEHFLFNAFGCIVLPRLAAEYSFRESVCGIYREY